ncbi:MAG: hypothetical protein IPP90_09800 [Gemmatimonadaceae bacterium]|nr:hypothetical protein [Gemmatimonadaceae bacterium]
MARKPNYDFDKRRKELDRKAAKDKKLEERRLRRLAGPVADDLIEPLDGPAVEGDPVEGESAEITGDQP